jgi:hypothetical protein
VSHPQVVEAVLGHLAGAGHGPQVADLQAVPVQPSDAACVVAPRDSRTEGQLLGRVPVRAGEVDLASHREDPWPDRSGLGILGMEEQEELLRRGPEQFGVRTAGTAFSNGPRHVIEPSPDPAWTW